MRKKTAILLSLVGLLVLLTGCTQVNEPITPDSEGIWNKFFVYPLSWLITEVAQFFGSSYGLAIILVTILIRLVLLPLMVKQTKSQVAMQQMQPEIQKLREKYSSKDPETQRKLQEETMRLFQETGANPFSGCLPLLVQMPILLGFYHAIMRTQEIKNHSFLWFDLGNPDPIFLLPILAAILTYLQQKIMIRDMDDVPQQLKMMTYMMPVMILMFGIFLPAALSLYWVIGTCFTIGQTLFVTGPAMRAAKVKHEEERKEKEKNKQNQQKKKKR
ncbi:MAG TPA: YidC family membrane integrase SpoIIIJ [Massilibacterium sp.]|nr:YidC family membrane integrase SpoIIIJ [Massilibacterium sp.]